MEEEGRDDVYHEDVNYGMGEKDGPENAVLLPNRKGLLSNGVQREPLLSRNSSTHARNAGLLDKAAMKMRTGVAGWQAKLIQRQEDHAYDGKTVKNPA